MSGGSGRSTYTFRSEAPLWTRTFLERVADALARAPSGHAVLLEQDEGDRSPRITSRRPELEGALRAAARSLPGRLAPIPRPISPGGAWARSLRVGFLVRRVGSVPEPDPRARRSGAPETEPVPRSGALGVHAQAHWFPDPTGRL